MFMSLKILKDDIKNNTIRNLYLLTGQEEFLIEHYMEMLVSKVIDPTFEDFNLLRMESVFPIDKISAFCQGYPMMSEKKMLLFKNTGVLKKPKADIKEYLEELLSDIPNHIVIVFVERETDGKLKVNKLIKKNGLTVNIDYLKRADLFSWVSKGVRKNKLEMDNETIDYFIENSDPSKNSMKKELE